MYIVIIMPYHSARGDNDTVAMVMVYMICNSMHG